MKNLFKKLIGSDKKKNECCDIKITEIQESDACCEKEQECCNSDKSEDKQSCCSR